MKKSRLQKWEIIKPYYEEGLYYSQISDKTGIPKSTICDLIRDLSTNRNYEKEIHESIYKRQREDNSKVPTSESAALIENIKLKAVNQNLRDSRNLAEKRLREINRVRNSDKEFIMALKDIEKKFPKIKPPTKLKVSKNEVGIIQLSDLHLNERIFLSDTKGSNEFNFEIAAKRLQKYANECISYFNYRGINEVIIVFTGDIFNSDRRIDEKIRNSYNNTMGFRIGQDIISQFILDICSGVKKVAVATCYGNESRLDQDIGSIGFSNNWDFLTHTFQEKVLSSQKNLKFLKLTDDHELLLNINGMNILLFHGHNRMNFKKISAKYAHSRIILDYVITGHIHETKIDGVESSRSASLPGNNAYSHQRLNLSSDAGQTFYVVSKESDKSRITPYPVNLQNTQGYKGYQVPKDSDIYGQRKSVSKANNKSVTIFKVVV